MAIPLLAMLGIGAATGMMKNQEKKRQYDAQKKIQAETTRMSPWTGMQAQAPEQFSSTGNVLEGAMGGLSMQQNFQNAANQQKLMDAQTNFLNSGWQQAGGASAPMTGMSMGYGAKQPYTYGNPWKF